MPKRGLGFLKEIEKIEILPLYYLYGEEGYLIDKAIKILEKRTLTPSLKEMNHHIFHSSEAEPSHIIDTCNTLPAFSPWRVVLIKYAHLFSQDQLDLFLPYIQAPSPTTILIFVGEKADLRRGFFKEIERIGGMVYFPLLKRNQLSYWIKKEAELWGKKITPEAMDCLIEMVGVNLRGISQEIGKLSLFVGKKDAIGLDDVEEGSANIRVNSVFDLTDAIGNRDLLEALKALSKLLQWGEPSSRILSMIERHFRLLWRIKMMVKKGLNREGISARLGITPYILNIYLKQEQRFSFEELREIFGRLYASDLALKTGRTPAKVVLEGLSLRLCQG